MALGRFLGGWVYNLGLDSLGFLSQSLFYFLPPTPTPTPKQYIIQHQPKSQGAAPKALGSNGCFLLLVWGFCEYYLFLFLDSLELLYGH